MDWPGPCRPCRRGSPRGNPPNPRTAAECPSAMISSTSFTHQLVLSVALQARAVVLRRERLAHAGKAVRMRIDLAPRTKVGMTLQTRLFAMAGNALADVSRGGDSVVLRTEGIHPLLIVGVNLHIPRAERWIRVQSDPRPFVTTSAEGLAPMAARAARRLGARLERMRGEEVVGVHRERLLQRVMALLTIRLGVALAARQPVCLRPAAVAELVPRPVIQAERIPLHRPEDSGSKMKLQPTGGAFQGAGVARRGCG